MSSKYSLENIPPTSRDITSPRARKATGYKLSGPVNSLSLSELFDKDIPANKTSNSKKDEIQHALLEIRTRELPSGANHSPVYSFSTASTANQKKRLLDVIDLTEEDEDELAPPRKKSCSSYESSDESIRNVARLRKPIRHTRENNEPYLTAGPVRRKKGLRATPIPAHFSSRSPSLKPVSRSPSQETSGHNVPQYAAAVVIHPSAHPVDFTTQEVQRRQDFQRNMTVVHNVTLSNTIDNSSPPTDFRFINESVLTAGVSRAPTETLIGCDCHRKRGANECKYPNECHCLRDSNGESKVKRSQYHDSAFRKGCLMKHVLQNRWNIFECNPRCDCSDNCKNRVVQWGRKVGLDIFKTRTRGWGLRCNRDLLEGQFIDTYRGEVITTEEADRRKKDANEDNYLMDFDKFEDTKYVCDGMYMGGPTRFMNHSCQPNCALFTVSYNHFDPYLYELAFFAKEFIPAGTELTFDYLDQDDVDDGPITEEDAAEMEREKGYAPSVCRCGAENCRGYFFFSK